VTPVERIEQCLLNVGVDPAAVILGAVNRSGWGEATLDKDGKPIRDEQGVRVLTWHRWPAGTSARAVDEILALELERIRE
jgi:hypothetical protein